LLYLGHKTRLLAREQDHGVQPRHRLGAVYDKGLVREV
jgi:hypothetical protein